MRKRIAVGIVLATVLVLFAAQLLVAKPNKILVCHVPQGDPCSASVLSLPPPAVAAHLAQHVLDALGSEPCEEIQVTCEGEEPPPPL